MATASFTVAPDRLRVLTLAGCYPPGFRGGGPARSLANLVQVLCDEIAFSIVTLDRDSEADGPYPGIVPGQWQQREGAEVLYLPRRAVSTQLLRDAVQTARPDVIYLNGFLDPLFSLRILQARRRRRLAAVPILLAPRGDCSAGALAVKAAKKRLFIRVSRAVGLYRDLIWHASSELERLDILATVGPVADGRIHVVPNLTAATPGHPPARVPRAPGSPLRLCFLSRISPKKHLDFALEVLTAVGVPVTFTIYGPIEDEQYWAACRRLMTRLPAHVQAGYGGEVRPEDVARTLAGHDVFFLPTRGENFGHVIHEAFAAGLPVLTSDQTPWVDLERHGVGWSLPLDSRDAFVRAIEAASAASPDECAAMADRATAFAASQVDRTDTARRMAALFRTVAGR